MVSEKCTFQLSRSSTLASAAAIPPSAITVWAFPRSDLQTSPTDTPAADASIAARSPAPPAPMTTKRITAEQNDIDCENHRPNADAKHTFPCPWIDKPKRFPHVTGEDHNEKESEIEKIAVNVLHNQRERTFA